jgi:hypothetical protein
MLAGDSRDIFKANYSEDKSTTIPRLLMIISIGLIVLINTIPAQQAPQLGKDSLDQVIAAMSLEEKTNLVVGASRGPGGPGGPGGTGAAAAPGAPGGARPKTGKHLLGRFAPWKRCEGNTYTSWWKFPRITKAESSILF